MNKRFIIAQNRLRNSVFFIACASLATALFCINAIAETRLSSLRLVVKMTRKSGGIMIAVSIHNTSAQSRLVRIPLPPCLQLTLKTKKEEVASKLVMLSKPRLLQKSDFVVISPGKSYSAEYLLRYTTFGDSDGWIEWGDTAYHVKNVPFVVHAELCGIDPQERIRVEDKLIAVSKAFRNTEAKDAFLQYTSPVATGETK